MTRRGSKLKLSQLIINHGVDASTINAPYHLVQTFMAETLITSVYMHINRIGVGTDENEKDSFIGD